MIQIFSRQQYNRQRGQYLFSIRPDSGFSVTVRVSSTNDQPSTPTPPVLRFFLILSFFPLAYLKIYMLYNVYFKYSLTTYCMIMVDCTVV
jgi:hypothetical protein